MDEGQPVLHSDVDGQRRTGTRIHGVPLAGSGFYDRECLRAGQRIRGPAIIREPMSTTHVVAGQQARVGTHGELIIERTDRV